MKKLNKSVLTFFLAYQRPYVFWAIGAGFLLLITVLLKLPSPLITRYLIDTIIPQKDFNSLHFLCILLLVLIIVSNVATLIMRLLFAKYKAKVHYRVEKDIYKHIQTLPLSFFTSKSSGYIMSRISELAAVDMVMADTFLFGIRDFITIVTGIVLVLNLHFKLGLFSVIVLPIFIFSIRVFYPKIKRVNKKQKEYRAKYLGKLEKNINSIEKIKSSVKEESELERMATKLWASLKMQVKTEFISAFAAICSAVIGMIAPFFVLWYGVSEIMRGELTLGTFVAMNAFLTFLYGPAQNLTNIGYNLSQAMAGLERVYEIFQEDPEAYEGVDIEKLNSITFQNVSFSYNENDWILEGLNLKINPGDKLAIVGSSGAGKTTLIRLIMKFYSPTKGEICFSGIDSTKVGVRSLRSKIAYIGQNQKLLEDELKEMLNLKDAERVFTKLNLQKASIRDAIMQKELSGGESQRFEFMEVFLKNADILIIDEGTSNLDSKSENTVINEIFEKFADKIIIFITHRLTTVKHFDRVINLNKGSAFENIAAVSGGGMNGQLSTSSY
jgi:ABC-type bacteriocin/lantibiotic exporter with double-glycine peptidase domain